MHTKFILGFAKSVPQVKRQQCSCEHGALTPVPQHSQGALGYTPSFPGAASAASALSRKVDAGSPVSGSWDGACGFPHLLLWTLCLVAFRTV